MRVKLIADEAVIGLGHYFDFFLLIYEMWLELVDSPLRLHDGASKLFIKKLVKLFVWLNYL